MLLKYEHLGGGPLGTLKFLDDDGAAWKLLLWWKVEGNLPAVSRCLRQSEVSLYIRAWIMGDKYDVKGFQDDLMFELITWLQSNGLEDLTVARYAFENTMPGSTLRILMAEEIAHQCRQTNEPKGCHKLLEQFEGIVGFTAEIVDAFDMYENFGKDGLKRERCLHLEWYMVGEGPRRGRSCVL